MKRGSQSIWIGVVFGSQRLPPNSKLKSSLAFSAILAASAG